MYNFIDAWPFVGKAANSFHNSVITTIRGCTGYTWNVVTYTYRPQYTGMIWRYQAVKKASQCEVFAQETLTWRTETGLKQLQRFIIDDAR